MTELDKLFTDFNDRKQNEFAKATKEFENERLSREESKNVFEKVVSPIVNRFSENLTKKGYVSVVSSDHVGGLELKFTPPGITGADNDSKISFSSGTDKIHSSHRIVTQLYSVTGKLKKDISNKHGSRQWNITEVAEKDIEAELVLFTKTVLEVS